MRTGISRLVFAAATATGLAVAGAASADCTSVTITNALVQITGQRPTATDPACNGALYAPFVPPGVTLPSQSIVTKAVQAYYAAMALKAVIRSGAANPAGAVPGAAAFPTGIAAGAPANVQSLMRAFGIVVPTTPGAYPPAR